MTDCNYPQMDFSEDDALSQALALSLVTVKEDADRRKKLYGTVDIQPHPSASSGRNTPASNVAVPLNSSSSQPNLQASEYVVQTSVNVRPRPQPAKPSVMSIGRSSTPPTIPPRPVTTSPKKEPTAAARSRLHSAPPPLPSKGPNTAFSSTSNQSNDAKVTKITSPDYFDDQPLIMLSPRQSKPMDYTLDNFDPLKADYLADIKPSDKRSSAPPSAKTSLFNPAISVAGPPGSSKTSSQLSNKQSFSNTLPRHPPIPPRPSSGYATTERKLSKRSLSPISNSDPISTLDSISAAMDSGLIVGPPSAGLYNPPSSAGVLPHAIPRPARSPQRRASPEPGELPRHPSAPAENDFNPMKNLIDLSVVGEEDDTEQDYLTLASFDPLYSVQEPTNSTSTPDSPEKCESLGLFPNPLNPFERKETPNPFPSINAVSTLNLLKKTPGSMASLADNILYKHYDTIEESEAMDQPGQVSSPAAAPGHKRSESCQSVELQDPFSVSDLTKELEKKRKKHAKEQKKRDEEEKKKAKAKEEKTKQAIKRPSPVNRLSRSTSYLAKGQESSYECLHESAEGADEEIRDFCQMVARIKLEYQHTDSATNPGLLISSRTPHPTYTDMTVKLVVTARFLSEKVVFTCDVNAMVSHVISQVLLSVTDNLDSTSTDSYIVKVYGLSEYMLNDTILSEYAYIENCLKLDEDIRLVLVDLPHLQYPFLRVANDMQQPVLVPKARGLDDVQFKVTRDKLNILMETFYKEVEKLRDQAIQVGCGGVHSKSVTQAVKALCMTLLHVETIDIIKAVKKLAIITKQEVIRVSATSPDAHIFIPENFDVYNKADTLNRKSQTFDLNDLHIALEDLTTAVKCLIELYCRTFHTDFRFESASVVKEIKEVTDFPEALIVNVATAHRIPFDKFKSKFDDFKVKCCLYYGDKQLVPEVVTHSRPTLSQGCQKTLVWDEWLQFDSVILSLLPRECRLCFTMFGVRSVTSGETTTHVNVPLGWANMQIYNHKFELVQGSQLLGLWPGDRANPLGTTISNTDNPNSILLQINMPDFGCDITFPSIAEPIQGLKQDFKVLHPDDQEELLDIMERDSISKTTQEELELVWEKRHYLMGHPEALSWVMQAAPGWSGQNLRELYSIVRDWADVNPTQTFELLLPTYADTYVRSQAVRWLSKMTSDELVDYLPQLLQTLKFECYHTSALSRLLLERCMCNVRVAHYTYWLLKEAADDVRYRKRYQLLFGALLSIVGANMQKEFNKQEDMVKILGAIAEKVKAAKDREVVLHTELGNMWDFLSHPSVRLPINPAMEVTGVDVKSCSYFTSFTFPLRLVLHNVDRKTEPVYVMFKVGDDLRQDMLTMQMVNIMDRLWLKAGLDLRMLSFSCLPTGPKKGLVELVTESDTLRKIQVKHGHGLAGSFKDRPIAEWLQVQNPTELEYQKAVDNFTYSCAGYCVATYVLGICDRHNDNIMIKQSGHLFHIDFSKFLGDSQMFGSIKRDRVPFVLTSDMAYVINSGDKPSHRFQQFVDLCCQAFNILRAHSNLLINLFSLMSQSGIPGVGQEAPKYVQKALMPECSDAEATAAFTRMIRDSMKSLFTQINFFIHNLAQLKFSSHNEGALLSFCPKTYSIETDGRISSVDIFGFQKRYNPEKYYIYIIKVMRESQKIPTFVFRRYSEFQELHHKLLGLFPLVRLPSLTNNPSTSKKEHRSPESPSALVVLLGRTHIKTVAEARKCELETFLKGLLDLASEISEHDVIYTFFHPMLRDEQDVDKTNMQKLKEPSRVKHEQRSNVKGSLKLSVFYKNSTLTVMVMHAKDLSSQTGEVPDPYVKLYLLPDPAKMTKRKTKIAKDSCNPTYNEMLLYRLPLEEVKRRTLQASAWNYNTATENEFLGVIFLDLGSIDLAKETTQWYQLHPFSYHAGLS